MSAIPKPISFAERFTGFDMLKIDMANTYGLDKELFETRIQWVNQNQTDILNNLDEWASQAEEPLMFRKACYAFADAVDGKPINHNMFMDATASGLQIMAALSGCKKTAEAVNLINNGQRNDAYTAVSDALIAKAGENPMFTRSYIKKPIMTHYYNSKAKPKELLGEDTMELNMFYEILMEKFTGAEAVMQVINNAWDPFAYFHQWTLPDGHVAKVNVVDQVDARIEVDELNHMQFTYRFYPNQPSDRKTSLAPNIIHSIDGYVAREIIRRADFEVAHIHDAFTCHPNHMPKVMDFYRDILAEIAESNLLSDIISEITGTDVQLKKFSYDLAEDIRKSEYMLS